MKLNELILETAANANTFLRFYKAFNDNMLPDEDTVEQSLYMLEYYYDDYLKWYDNRPERKAIELRVYKDFAKRLQQIRKAMRSPDIRVKIEAVDDGINQWHIDYPVVAHLSMDDEDQEKDWEEVFMVIKKLGRLPKESPYKDIYQ